MTHATHALDAIAFAVSTGSLGIIVGIMAAAIYREHGMASVPMYALAVLLALAGLMYTVIAIVAT